MVDLTKASNELFRRKPDERYETLDELLRHCRDLQEQSQDHWQLPHLIEPTAVTGELKLAIGTDGALALNDWSFGQLCSMARVQKSTVNRLSPATAAKVLSETKPSGSKPLQVLGMGKQLRSLHGVAYSRLWNADVVSLLREYDDFQPSPKGFNGATGL